MSSVFEWLEKSIFCYHVSIEKTDDEFGFYLSLDFKLVFERMKTAFIISFF